MVATPETARCELCGMALDVQVERGNGAARFQFTLHTVELCKTATLTRLRSLVAQLADTSRRHLDAKDALDELSRWISCMTDIVDAGRKWLPLLAKRAEDMARLRGAFEADAPEISPRSPLHPLWLAEGEVAEAITKAISQVEIQKTRMPT